MIYPNICRYSGNVEDIDADKRFNLAYPYNHAIQAVTPLVETNDIADLQAGIRTRRRHGDVPVFRPFLPADSILPILLRALCSRQ